MKYKIEVFMLFLINSLNLKRITLLILLFASFSLNAQWIKLPNPQLQNPLWFPSLGTYLTGIIPVEDGKIVYSTYTYLSASSGSTSTIVESNDDLNSEIQKYSIHALGTHISGFQYFKDSNFVFISGSGGFDFLTITKDDFQHNDGFFWAGVGPYHQLFDTYDLTKSFIYVTSQQTAQDTFKIVKIATQNLNQESLANLTAYDGQINSINFLNDSVGHVFCRYKNNLSKQVLLKTNDYGVTWSEILLDSLVGIKAFYFPTENVGYILRNDGIILKTYNGGNTWLTNNISLNNQLNCIQFSNDSIGYLGGAAGLLYKTTDGGNTWNTELSNTTFSITSLYTFTNDVAYFKDSTNALYKNHPLKILPVSPLNVTLSASQTTVCPGSAVTLTASGASNYTWSSQTGTTFWPQVTVHPEISTVYTVIGKNSTGIYADTQSVLITVFPIPQINCTPLSAEICKNSGDSITYTGSNADNYVWHTDWANVYSNVLTVSSNINSTYILTATDSNGCSGTKEVQLNIIECPDFTIYPNPSSTFFTIKSISTPIVSVKLSSLLGQDFYDIPVNKNIYQFDVSSINEGVYILSVKTDKNTVEEKILIKR